MNSDLTEYSSSYEVDYQNIQLEYTLPVHIRLFILIGIAFLKCKIMLKLPNYPIAKYLIII